MKIRISMISGKEIEVEDKKDKNMKELLKRLEDWVIKEPLWFGCGSNLIRMENIEMIEEVVG